MIDHLRRRFSPRVFSVLHNSSSTAFRSALSMIGGILVAGILGPKLMGLVATVRLWGDYGTLLTMGLSNGMLQLVPFHRGQGQEQRCRELRNAAFTFLLAILGLFLILAAVARPFLFADVMPLVFWGSVLLPMAVAFNQMVNASATADQQIGKMSQSNMMIGAASLFLAALAYLGAEGGIARLLVLAVVEAAVLGRLARYFPKIRFNLRDGLSLIGRGLPIVLLAFLVAFTIILDRTLVKMILGTEALGLYTLATLVATNAMVLAQPIMRVLVGPAGELYGKTKDRRAVAAMLLRPLAKVSGAALLIGATGALLLPPLIRLLLPEYEAGILAAQIACAAAGLRIFIFYQIYFTLTKDMWPPLLLQASCLMLQFVLSMALLDAGWGLSALSTAMVAGAGCYAAGLVLMIWMIHTGRWQRGSGGITP